MSEFRRRRAGKFFHWFLCILNPNSAIVDFPGSETCWRCTTAPSEDSALSVSLSERLLQIRSDQRWWTGFEGKYECPTPELGLHEKVGITNVRWKLWWRHNKRCMASKAEIKWAKVMFPIWAVLLWVSGLAVVKEWSTHLVLALRRLWILMFNRIQSLETSNFLLKVSPNVHFLSKATILWLFGTLESQGDRKSVV